MKKAYSILLGILLITISATTFAQPAGDKQINPYHQHYADSLKAMDYKSFFPIWGKKAYKKGFDVPLPYGVGLNYFYMKQGIDITSTKIGFNGGNEADLSGILHYGDVVNTTNVITFRPDLWVLPFLNVYGVAGYGSSSVTVPISAIGNQAVDFSTKQDFGISSLGFGVTLAGGVGPVFLTLDNNINWAKISIIDKAVPAYCLDVRIGHSFIDARHPERSLTVWAGAFMQSIRSSTIGHIAMSDVLTQDKADQITAAIEDSDLPEFKKKILEDGLQKIENSTVDYQLDKKVAGPWNMIFGAQYQYNKHWQCRVELGTFGERTQFMFSLNYRFLK